CVVKFLTFSMNSTLGLWYFAIRATSKNKVPLVSSNPFRFPEMLNGWQGNPAQRMSCEGIFSASIFVISPCGTTPKFSKYVLWACLSNSDEKTHVAPNDCMAM